MAQYDVYPNPSRASRDAVPYVVEVQSNLLRHLTTRIVVPLALPEHVGRDGPRALCPDVEVGGQALKVLSYLVSPVRSRELGRPVASLLHESACLVRALDAVIAGV